MSAVRDKYQGMIVALVLAVAFLGLGFMLLNKKRGELVEAMRRDGFAEHEIRKAIRLFDRKRHAEMIEHCRSVIERRALRVTRDWTKLDSYTG